MANFVHTADLHLRASKEKGIEVLLFVMQFARESKGDVIIAGDLFDSEADANALRSAVRQAFNNFPEVSVFILPGNHDEHCYLSSEDWGENVIVLSEQPFSTVSHKDVRIIGFPFVTGRTLRTALAGYIPPEMLSIAVIHGTFFGKNYPNFYKDIEESEDEYFPIFESDLNDIGCNYIALGHFHSKFTKMNLGSQIVCYPGSPLLLSEAEKGKRSIAKVTADTKSGSIICERVEVPVSDYIISKKFYIFAGAEESIIPQLHGFIESSRDKRACLNITLEGYSQIQEKQLNDIISALKRDFEEEFSSLSIRSNVVSYEKLISEQPLVGEFIKLLNQKEGIDEAVRARALELGLRAFQKAKRRKR